MHIKKKAVSLLLALALIFSMIPTSAWAEEAAAEDAALPAATDNAATGTDENTDSSAPSDESAVDATKQAPVNEAETETETEEEPASGTEEAFQYEIITEEETWEITCIFPVSPLARSAVSSTTAYINTSDFPYTNTTTGQAMAVHWIRGSSGYLEFAWCIEPNKTAVNGDAYGFETESSAQRVADVLQIGYEWGYWGGMQSDGLPTNSTGHAAVQIALWRALGYTAVCSSSSVNSMADELLSAANSDSGCGGGSIYQYRCTSNTSRQRLITYEPYRAETEEPEPVIEYGSVQLKKSSANAQLTSGNSCYSLSSAVYGVYSSRSNALNDKRRLGTLTTKANGESNTVSGLEAGYTYFVKELTSPKGYALDSTVYTVSVTANRTSVLTVKDTPQSDPVGVLLKKVDATTGKGETRS